MILAFACTHKSRFTIESEIVCLFYLLYAFRQSSVVRSDGMENSEDRDDDKF